jgi:hypothetical protein
MQSLDRCLAFRGAAVSAAGVFVIVMCFAFPGTARAQVTVKEKAKVKAEGAAAILEKMRRAAGTAEPSSRPAELLIEGKVQHSGLTSDYSLRFASKGTFLQSVLGPLPGKVGFNGKDCWSTDNGGMPLRLVLHDLDHNQLLIGLQTGQWLAGADGASVAIARKKAGRDEAVLDVKQGRLKAELRVSSETWLPKSLSCSGVCGPETWTFDDYREFGGLKVPGMVTVALAGETETYRVGSIGPAPAAPKSIYDIAARPDDTRFDAAAPAGLAVKRAMTGHVLVRPVIDGQEIGWFILDTSAGSNVIEAAAAAKLKLERLGSASVTNIKGNEPSSIFRAKSLALGPMTIARPLFVTMNLSNIQMAMGSDVVGVAGYDVLARCVAEIALADDSVKLLDPKSHQLESGVWQPLLFNQNSPLVPARFEGNRKGLFRIDVGASGMGGVGNVVFHSPAVQQFRLLKGRNVSTMMLGPTDAAMGTIAWFELAGHRFKNPEVVFAIDKKGPFGDEYVEGNIGVDFLKPFRVVLDFGNERVAFLQRGKGR